MTINVVLQENNQRPVNGRASSVAEGRVRRSSSELETPEGVQGLEAQVAAHTREISALRRRVHELEDLIKQVIPRAVVKVNNIPGQSKVTEPARTIDGKRSFISVQGDAEGDSSRSPLSQKRKRETSSDDDNEERRTKQQHLLASNIHTPGPMAENQSAVSRMMAFSM